MLLRVYVSIPIVIIGSGFRFAVPVKIYLFVAIVLYCIKLKQFVVGWCVRFRLLFCFVVRLWKVK